MLILFLKIFLLFFCRNLKQNDIKKLEIKKIKELSGTRGEFRIFFGHKYTTCD